jgi:hypothetical protein
MQDDGDQIIDAETVFYFHVSTILELVLIG